MFIPRGHRGRHTLVEIVEHDLLVLLEQLVGELGGDLHEGDVGGRAGGVVGVLEGRDGKKDALAVELGHRLAVLEGVEAEAQGEPARKCERFSFQSS